MANLSKTLRINFYQNRSSIVEVMIKKFWCVFLCLTVYYYYYYYDDRTQSTQKERKQKKNITKLYYILIQRCDSITCYIL